MKAFKKKYFKFTKVMHLDSSDTNEILQLGFFAWGLCAALPSGTKSVILFTGLLDQTEIITLSRIHTKINAWECVCVCMCECVCVHARALMRTRMCTHVHTCMCACMHMLLQALKQNISNQCKKYQPNLWIPCVQRSCLFALHHTTSPFPVGPHTNTSH